MNRDYLPGLDNYLQPDDPDPTEDMSEEEREDYEKAISDKEEAEAESRYDNEHEECGRWYDGN